MSENWKPADEQILEDAWEDLRDLSESIQKDIACPDETIAKLLRSVAGTFDESVEEILDKEQESWEDN